LAEVLKLLIFENVKSIIYTQYLANSDTLPTLDLLLFFSVKMRNHIEFELKSLKERDHLGDLGIDGQILLD
jgi:hypothetical protein